LRTLLDTDVISQATKDQPNEHVLEWIDEQEEDDLFLSVATLLEIRVGIESLDPGKKRERLERWLVHDLPERFDGRIVPVERHAADLAARIMVRSRRDGWHLQPMDSLIAATAMVNDMALATLNRKDFERLSSLTLVEF